MVADNKLFADVKITDWLMAVFTLLLTVLAFFQFHEMRVDSKIAEQNRDIANSAMAIAQSSSEVAHRALDAQMLQISNENRPWLSIRDGRIERQVDKVHDYQVAVTAINTGRTPAMAVFLDYAIATDEEEMSIQELRETISQAERRKVGPTMINPSQTHPVWAQFSLTRSEAQYFERTKSYVYFWGTITYRDVDKHPHSTTFCAYAKFSEPHTRQCPIETMMD